MKTRQCTFSSQTLTGARTTCRALPVAVTILLLSALACSGGTPSPTAAQPTPTAQDSPAPQTSIFDTGRTAYGFFPSSPELTPESFMATLGAIGQHADVILIQPQVPWAEFIDAPDAESPTIKDMQGTIGLARQNGLEPIFVIDPLQALDRSTIATFPPALAGSDFSTPGVRQAFTNFALRLVREFHPRYLGLASEINTYADAHPEDFDNYVSLYRETYTAVKREAPETQIFVTFQWEDLNSVGLFANDSPGRIKWETVETFEPDLDVWAISTYPYFAFNDTPIPADYYTPLLSRTSKPLAIGEGGYLSEDAGPFQGSPERQIAYLEALDAQIGDRLAFWVYLVIDDINVEAYAQYLSEHGSPAEVEVLALFGTLGLRTYDGDPKPALETWDRLRGTE